MVCYNYIYLHVCVHDHMSGSVRICVHTCAGQKLAAAFFLIALHVDY